MNLLQFLAFATHKDQREIVKYQGKCSQCILCLNMCTNIVSFRGFRSFCVTTVGFSVVPCDEFHATSPLSLQTICFFLHELLWFCTFHSHTQRNNNNNKNITWTFPNNFSFCIRNVFSTFFSVKDRFHGNIIILNTK